MKSRQGVTALLAAIVLSGCTVQDLPNGGVAFHPVTMNQFLGTASPTQYAGSQPSSYTGGPAASSSFPSHNQTTASYRGQLEGGNGSMTITYLGHMAYHIDVSVQSMNGAGQVSGTAYRRGADLYMTQGTTGTDQTPYTCQLKLVPESNGVGIIEQDCSYFHGATVSFNGVLGRTG